MSVFASGPAREIWSKSFGQSMFCDDINKTIDWADIILAGTGWSTNIEKKAIYLAQKLNKPCIAYFDHWTNYGQRLSWNGLQLTPSVIWVSDKEAKHLAQQNYPDIPIEQVPNVYLLNEANKIKPIKSNVSNALYICEPIMKDGAISSTLTLKPIYFTLSRIEEGLLGNITSLILRPHPSQTKQDFSELFENSTSFKIEISEGQNLSEDISVSSLIIGYHSFALVIAAAAKRQVYCSAPKGWRNSALKLPNLNYLRDL